MQAVKDKLSDMNTMRKAKAEAKAEEKAVRDLAKTRADMAHEVRLAREAEAEMNMHVEKARQMAQKVEAKHGLGHMDEGSDHGTTSGMRMDDQHPTNTAAGGAATAAGALGAAEAPTNPPQGNRFM